MKRILLMAVIFAAVPASLVQAARQDADVNTEKKECGSCHRPWRWFGNRCCSGNGQWHRPQFRCNKDRCAKNSCRSYRRAERAE